MMSRAPLAITLAILAACSGPTSTPEPTQPVGANISCSTSNTVTLALGEVRTVLAGNGVCVHSTANTEYMVHGFFASTVSASQTQVGVTGFGIVAAAAAPSADRSPITGGIFARTPATTSRRVAPDPREQLDRRFRNLERTVLTPRMAGARAAMTRRGALRAAAPPSVGQILQLNVDEDCDTPAGVQPTYRYGRVVAVTNTAIIVADTLNPAGGFTDAEYASVGVTFDTLVDPLDRGAFGAPSDIDANSRVILFYTSAVNQQTPASSGFIVEGYFNPRDLFPRTNSAIGFCTASNVAEMFYLIVPDPNGVINGNVRTKAQVQQFTIGTTAHEYQHLINAARRIYVNNADSFEEVWLNEGLSHIAEELLYYHAAGLTPRVNIDATSIRSSTQRLNAVNAYQIQNLTRYDSFLDNPLTNSAYADNDSLATRGATWAFLRYAADRKAAADGTIWQQLVNSTTAGMANLTNVFGGTILDEFRDWSMSVFTDDFVSTAAAYQQPSWSYRTVLPLISGNAAPKSSSLTNATATSVTLSGGGSLYARLGIPNNAIAAIEWSVNSPSVQMSIVRTK